MKFLTFSFSLICLLLIAQTAYSQAPNTGGEVLALGGYDVVAYFNANDAVRGNNDHTAKIDGMIYYFSTADNQKVFQQNPSQYQPQYGGNCAFAMAMKGAAVPSDPTTFKIRDGKLYLFFNDYYEGKPFNTIIPWNTNKSESGLVAKAEANWAKL